jgi:hypothetical protein
VTAIDSIGYEFVREEVYDEPIKTQVLEHLHTIGVPSETQLRHLLTSRAERLKARTGFRYHPTPTNIGVYVYETAEQAKAGQGLQMGMLFWRPEDGPPEITINELVLNAAGQSSTERFGLSEAKRKEIYAEHVRAEDRGQAEAERRRPLGDRPTSEALSAQTELANELQERYRRHVARRYGISRETMDSIAIEAMSKAWPQPDLE